MIQVLRAHQKKVKEDKIKEIQERKEKKEQEPPKETTEQGTCKFNSSRTQGENTVEPPASDHAKYQSYTTVSGCSHEVVAY